MPARRLTPMLPATALAEAVETTRIHRIAGLTGGRTGLVTTRPCRAPHQTLSEAGLIGGGHMPLSGEGPLAHNGLLFLDARPECRRHILEVWRQPLEGGVVYIQFRGRPRPHGLGAAGGAQGGCHSHVSGVSAHLPHGFERCIPRNGRADCLEARRALAVNDFACGPALRAPEENPLVGRWPALAPGRGRFLRCTITPPEDATFRRRVALRLPRRQS
jgi:hypothetical protein